MAPRRRRASNASRVPTGRHAARIAEGEASQSRSTSLLSNLRQHPFVVLAVAIVVLIAAAAALVWWLNARQYESTDDAFIDARTVSISAQVNGAIVEVPVTDNQVVEAGAVLVRIDDRDYRAAVDQAKAQVDQASANIANLDAQIEAQQARIDQAQKQVAQAQAALTFSQEENARAQDLLQARRRHPAAGAADGVRSAAEAGGARCRAGQSGRGAKADRGAEDAARESRPASSSRRNAAKEQADANLARTVIAAPVAGRVTKLTAAKGGYAQPGQSLMMFVPREVWVTANFKETQLADMRPGQPVDIRIDAYPGRPFQGHVDSIQSGSGAAFSLLPPENATGNYVKVVQRVPVKIVFDAPPDVYLGPGMSVVPTSRCDERGRARQRPPTPRAGRRPATAVPG